MAEPRDKNGIPYYVWYRKIFDGRSANELMNLGELEQHHIDRMIEEVRLMDVAYDRSGFVRSNAKPVSVSAPHQFELDFGDE